MKTLYARPSSGDQMESNLIPMINIIFLLLIFFMVAGHISKQAKPEHLTLVTAQSEHKVEAVEIKLSMTNDGQYYQNNAKTSLAEIKALLGQKNKIDTINLQADKQVTSGDLDVLLDILRAAQVNNVAMTVVKP